jgi:hypothetical protein
MSAESADAKGSRGPETEARAWRDRVGDRGLGRRQPIDDRRVSAPCSRHRHHLVPAGMETASCCCGRSTAPSTPMVSGAAPSIVICATIRRRCARCNGRWRSCLGASPATRWRCSTPRPVATTAQSSFYQPCPGCTMTCRSRRVRPPRSFLKNLARVELLILDANDHRASQRLPEIMEDWHARHSTINPLPVERWHDSVGDPTIAWTRDRQSGLRMYGRRHVQVGPTRAREPQSRVFTRPRTRCLMRLKRGPTFGPPRKILGPPLHSRDRRGKTAPGVSALSLGKGKI